jgi:hypothetical protein
MISQAHMIEIANRAYRSATKKGVDEREMMRKKSGLLTTIQGLCEYVHFLREREDTKDLAQVKVDNPELYATFWDAFAKYQSARMDIHGFAHQKYLRKREELIKRLRRRVRFVFALTSWWAGARERLVAPEGSGYKRARRSFEGHARA